MLRHLTAALILMGLSASLPAEDQPIPIYNSISTKPLVEPVAKQYMQAHPGTTFAMMAGLSSDAIKAAGTGETAMASVVRDLKDAEKQAYPDLKTIPFCIDMLVLVVHKDNPVSDLTLAQAKGLFTGEFASWKRWAAAMRLRS